MPWFYRITGLLVGRDLRKSHPPSCLNTSAHLWLFPVKLWKSPRKEIFPLPEYLENKFFPSVHLHSGMEAWLAVRADTDTSIQAHAQMFAGLDPEWLSGLPGFQPSPGSGNCKISWHTLLLNTCHHRALGFGEGCQALPPHKGKRHQRFNVSPGAGTVLLRLHRNNLLQTQSEHEKNRTFKEWLSYSDTSTQTQLTMP